jgi:hypothetical protein
VKHAAKPQGPSTRPLKLSFSGETSKQIKLVEFVGSTDKSEKRQFEMLQSPILVSFASPREEKIVYVQLRRLDDCAGRWDPLAGSKVSKALYSLRLYS